MSPRVDSASRIVAASPAAVYRAFAQPGAMERWIPPRGMTGEMLSFEFREGGSYRMRLTYSDPQRAGGKTTDDSDEVEARIVGLIDGQRIEQSITFDSVEPAFSGVMRMTWTFQSAEGGTLVTVRAENVPAGIRPEDHAAGLRSTLDNLAAFLEA